MNMKKKKSFDENLFSYILDICYRNISTENELEIKYCITNADEDTYSNNNICIYKKFFQLYALLKNHSVLYTYWIFQRI